MHKIFDILVLLVLLLVVLKLYSSFRYDKKVFFCLCCTIVLTLTFRDVGLDLENYRSFYQGTKVGGSIDTTEFVFNFELAWKLIILVLKNLHLPFEAFLFASVLVPLCIMFYISNKISRIANPYLILLLFLGCFYLISIDIIRGFYSACLISLSIYIFTQKNNYKWSAFVYVLSVLFHNSALFFPVLMLFARWNRIQNRTVYLTVLLLVVVSIAIIFKPSVLNILSAQFVDDRDGSFIGNIVFKIKYYMMYYQSHGYHYITKSHYYLTYAKVVSWSLFSLIGFFVCLETSKSDNKFISSCSLLYVPAFILYSILLVFGLNVIGGRLLSVINFNLIFVMAYYICCYRNIYLKTILYTVISLNFILFVMYLAGFHSPQSPFFLGF